MDSEPTVVGTVRVQGLLINDAQLLEDAIQRKCGVTFGQNEHILVRFHDPRKQRDQDVSDRQSRSNVADMGSFRLIDDRTTNLDGAESASDVAVSHRSEER